MDAWAMDYAGSPLFHEKVANYTSIKCPPHLVIEGVRFLRNRLHSMAGGHMDYGPMNYAIPPWR